MLQLDICKGLDAWEICHERVRGDSVVWVSYYSFPGKGLGLADSSRAARGRTEYAMSPASQIVQYCRSNRFLDYSNGLRYERCSFHIVGVLSRWQKELKTLV